MTSLSLEVSGQGLWRFWGSDSDLPMMSLSFLLPSEPPTRVGSDTEAALSLEMIRGGMRGGLVVEKGRVTQEATVSWLLVEVAELGPCLVLNDREGRGGRIPGPLGRLA